MSLLVLADAPREDDACPQHCTEQREEKCLGRRVHTSIVRRSA